jgi:membrane fusion protein, multidrug efflux system
MNGSLHKGRFFRWLCPYKLLYGTGESMNRIMKILAIMTLAVMLTGLVNCKKGSGPADGNPANEERQVVMVEELQPRDLPEHITVSGKLEGSGDILMVSETTGRIIRLTKKLGDRIEKGERLGITDNEVFRIQLDQAEAAKLSAESGFENARLNFSVAENLFRQNLISEVEYNSNAAAFKSAKAALDGATAGVEAARRNYDNSFLAAPASGIISRLLVTEGQYLSYGTQIAYLADNKNLVIKTGVGESQIGKLKQGQEADITVNGDPRIYKGQISGLGLRPLPGAANYPLEIRLLSSAGLQSGMVASARILSGVFRNQLYTSINNVIREYDRYYIYTVNQEDIVVRKEITPGRIIGENMLIMAGAEAGDRIVTTGADNIEDGALVQVRS